MNKLLLLTILPFMISCNGKETKPTQNENDKFKIDTLEFISYKDKMMRLTLKKMIRTYLLNSRLY